jgi:HSP20 family protein
MADEKELSKSTAAEVSSAEQTRGGRFYRPNVDILEREDELVVLADVPGAEAEDIDIDFEEGNLTIRAKVELRQPPETQYLLREYGVGDFFRTFQVSERIDASRITAECNDGVLTLHLPKVEAAKPRKIAVAGG